MTGARKPNVKEPVVVVVEDEPKVEIEKVEPLPEVEPEPDVPDEAEPVAWHPGRPCLTCGATNYKWTIQWGTTCSECSPEAKAAREAAE